MRNTTGVGVLLAFSFFCGAQCVVGTNQPPLLPPGTAWNASTQITVYINPTQFSDAQQDTIAGAFNAWSSTKNVTFVFTSSAPSANQTNTYVVNSATPSSSTAQAETGGTVLRGQGYRNSAFTNINPGVTNQTALAQVMAHEIGHTFGLDDCGSCTAHSTPMTEPGSANLNDTSTGATAPSSCDKSQAAASGNC